MNIVILGLSVTSSWSNGHASTFRGLVRELHKRGHHILLLERDVTQYASHRDLPNPEYCQAERYTSPDELKQRFTEQVREADMVIVGSNVPDGVPIGEWVCNTAQGIKAFYDIDTPVTLAKLERQDYDYLHPDLIPRYDLYLSSAGGPTLELLEHQYGSPKARAFYHSFDPELYFPEYREIKWDLGYFGNYSDDNQPALEKLMLDAAKQWPDGRFVVAGEQYPESLDWPANTQHIQHLPLAEQRAFYNSQRFTLNIASADKIKAGYTPSAQLFEAAACCIPIISDYWEGLDTFFTFDSEILVSYSAADTLRYLREICNSERKTIGLKARKKVLSRHTVAHRAQELESYAAELMTVGRKLSISDQLTVIS